MKALSDAKIINFASIAGQLEVTSEGAPAIWMGGDSRSAVHVSCDDTKRDLWLAISSLRVVVHAHAAAAA
jgi:hypothetical protein